MDPGCHRGSWYLRHEGRRAPEGEGRFSAIVSVFGNVDSQGDVIDKGAFAATPPTSPPAMLAADPVVP